MAGQWQVTSQRIIDPEEQQKGPDAVGFGVRKRPIEGDEELDLEPKKKKWNTKYRTLPVEGEEDDLDALLQTATGKGKEKVKNEEIKQEIKTEVKEEPGLGPGINDVEGASQGASGQNQLGIKAEPSEGNLLSVMDEAKESNLEQGDASTVQPPSAIVFKKRKAKNVRQK